MELAGRAAIIYVSEQGYIELKLLLGLESSLQGSFCQVVDTDDFAVWVAPEDGSERILGLPWHYLRAVELEKDLGLSPRTRESKKRIGF